MSSEVHRYETPPIPPPDESYWSALLAEGDRMAMEGEPQSSDSEWQHVSLSDVANRPGTGNAMADWEQVEQVYHTDAVVELRVIGYNRGGLLVEWGTLRGFVPASQIVEFPSEHESAAIRRTALTSHIGKKLKLRVIELERKQNRLILSERAAQTQAGARDHVFKKLRSGDICTGKVTNLCSFGAFVDLGGVEGLIHISELSWGRVRHPSDILQRDQEITVYVLNVHSDEGRVALSIKQLQSDPWITVEERYNVGQIIEGVITNVVDFGAFVCIENGLEGLVHISELAEGHFLHPYNVVHEGEKVKARILHIDGQERRLGLSLRNSSD